MQYIDIYDYLLLPVYLTAFYFIITMKSNKYAGTNLKKYCITAFFLHMLGSFLYCLVIQYYYGYGDSTTFYQGSNFIRKVVVNTGDPFSTFFMSSDDFTKILPSLADPDVTLPTGIDIVSNLTIMKISALLSYISFNSYVIISLFFGLFAFIGLWKLFSALNEVTDKKGERLLAIAVLYTPSVWFWGGGLIKDSVCIGAIGLIVYFVHKIFIKRKFKLKDPLLLILMFYLLFTIKNYLAGVLMASAVLSFVLAVILNSKKSPLRLLTVILVLVVSATVIVAGISSSVDSIIDDSKDNIETFKRAYDNADVDDERSMASFSATTINNSLTDIILASPVAIFTSLFRPFVWEAKKPIMLFSALESLITLLATLFVLIKCRVWKFFYYIFTDPYIFFCFVFSIALAAIVGFTTFNFGTLVRYRLPILPFYFFMLLFIYIKYKEPNAKATPAIADV